MKSEKDRDGLNRLDAAARRHSAAILLSPAGPKLTRSGRHDIPLHMQDRTIALSIDWRAERLMPHELLDADDGGLDAATARNSAALADAAAAWLDDAANRWASRFANRLRRETRSVAQVALDLVVARLPDAVRDQCFASPETLCGKLGGLAADSLHQARLQATAASIRLETGLDDWISLYPTARTMKRSLRLFVGPTNSGKTHKAFERLLAAPSGCYLAPLRLLALEGYDRLKGAGLPAALRTGEESREDGNAAHVAATVEMADLSTPVDVALVDEIQMMADPQRGWAWTAAVAGMPARELIMMGSADAEPMVRAIAKRTGDDLEVIRFERLSPLEVETHPLQLRDLAPGDALIAFSRAEVLRLRLALADFDRAPIGTLHGPTIYGALDPKSARPRQSASVPAQRRSSSRRTPSAWGSISRSAGWCSPPSTSSTAASAGR